MAEVRHLAQDEAATSVGGLIGMHGALVTCTATQPRTRYLRSTTLTLPHPDILVPPSAIINLLSYWLILSSSIFPLHHTTICGIHASCIRCHQYPLPSSFPYFFSFFLISCIAFYVFYPVTAALTIHAFRHLCCTSAHMSSDPAVYHLRSAGAFDSVLHMLVIH